MPAVTEVHIPAWKKLGLKLKSAPESAPTVPPPLPSLRPEKRKRDDVEFRADDTQPNPTKKAKKNSQLKPKGSSDAIVPNTSSTSIPSDKPIARPRKSVSFHPETKTDDGESAKDLYDSWVAGQKEEDPLFDPSSFNQDALRSMKAPPAGIKKSTTINQENDDSVTNTSQPQSNSTQHPSPPPQAPQQIQKKSKKKKKKRNKSKSTLLSSTTTSTSPHPPTSTTTNHHSPTNPIKPTTTTHPSLHYLHQHHTSPSTWKFSKNHSSHLLRHAFSLTHIPASYTPALVAYISSLQSEGARQRLVSAAHQIITEDEEWLASASASDFEGLNLLLGEEEEQEKSIMDDPLARKQLYLRAVREHKFFLKNMDAVEKERRWWERVERRKRADGVLAVLEKEVRWLEGMRRGGGGSGQMDWMKMGGGGSQMGGRVNGVGGGRMEGVNGGVHGNGKSGAAPLPPTAGGATNKPKRKRKRRTTGVPDDDESSSSSSSSSSSDSEEEQAQREVKKAKIDGSEKRVNRGAEVNGKKQMNGDGRIKGQVNGNGNAVIDLTDEVTSSSSGED
ncbi:MAG: hypothetical protein Q9222_005912 [Ikaeria aurantiellina]